MTSELVYLSTYQLSTVRTQTLTHTAILFRFSGGDARLDLLSKIHNQSAGGERDKQQHQHHTAVSKNKLTATNNNTNII